MKETITIVDTIDELQELNIECSLNMDDCKLFIYKSWMVVWREGEEYPFAPDVDAEKYEDEIREHFDKYYGVNLGDIYF